MGPFFCRDLRRVLKLAESASLDDIYRSVEALQQTHDALFVTLRKAKQFIYYARYELQLGKAVIGDQFPKQEDADNVTALIDVALASADRKESTK